MEIKKKEYEYNKRISDVDAGIVVAFEDIHEDDDNYYMVNDYDPYEILTCTSTLQSDVGKDYIMVTNLITGYTNFVAPYKKYRVVNLEVKELQSYNSFFIIIKFPSVIKCRHPVCNNTKNFLFYF